MKDGAALGIRKAYSQCTPFLSKIRDEIQIPLSKHTIYDTLLGAGVPGEAPTPPPFLHVYANNTFPFH